MPQIPEPGDSQPTEIIPPSVAELPQTEAPEILPYHISFASYNESECEIDGMKKPNAAAALKIVRDVGVHFTDQTNLLSKSRFIDQIKPVHCNGDYRKLYRRLAEGVEVKEIIYVKENRERDKSIDLRIFFYSLENERTFYVLAVRETHYNLDHS